MDRDYTERDTMEVARTVVADAPVFDDRATVITFSGELGAGKTTLIKDIAALLNVAETVASPTFVIAKFYNAHDAKWDKLIHIDAYRIQEDGELDQLGWKTLIKSPHTLMLIEWPERIEQKIPHDSTGYTIGHRDNFRHIARVSKQ